MADASVVVLVVLAAGSREPMHGTQVATAMREGAGGDVRVLVDERADAPPDGELVELAGVIRASAIAEVRWSDDQASRAVLHLYVASEARWYDRELTFAKSDARGDRERAVGLVLGAMVRAARDESPPEPAPPPAAPPPVAPAPPQPAAQPVDRRPAPVRTPDPQLVVEGGAGATTTDLGPSLRVGWQLIDDVFLRASGAMRFGAIPDADATTRTLRIGGGPAWRALYFGPERSLSLLVGLELAAVEQSVERDDGRRSRWITATYATIRLGWQASHAIEPYLAGGVETVFGSTPIVVGGLTLAEIPPVRAAAEAGVAFHFF